MVADVVDGIGVHEVWRCSVSRIEVFDCVVACSPEIKCGRNIVDFCPAGLSTTDYRPTQQCICEELSSTQYYVSHRITGC